MKHKFKPGDLVTTITGERKTIPKLYIVTSYRDTLVVELYCINNGTRRVVHTSYLREPKRNNEI